MSGDLLVEVVFADKDAQCLREVALDMGATVADAIHVSRLQREFPDHDLQDCSVGVWGKVVPLDHVLKSGDRVEIYRELEVDPMEARRIRAMAPDPDPYESR